MKLSELPTNRGSSMQEAKQSIHIRTRFPLKSGSKNWIFQRHEESDLAEFFEPEHRLIPEDLPVEPISSQLQSI